MSRSIAWRVLIGAELVISLSIVAGCSFDSAGTSGQDKSKVASASKDDRSGDSGSSNRVIIAPPDSASDKSSGDRQGDSVTGGDHSTGGTEQITIAVSGMT